MKWTDESINAISSRQDLVAYLQHLSQGMRAGDVRMENPSTIDYVSAASRWTESMDGYFENVVGQPVPDQPDWAMIAAIFRAAVVYE
ncbi:DUF7660 family protein [Streptomyces rimosus]|uniref:DUF7660 family protein n=1 Tax=Streptomyces rimosus TaxID=1927 RepID=UPI003791377D